MEATSAYILSVVTSLVFLLMSAIIANLIKFEGGSNPKDPQKRKTWFWILAVLTPFVTFLLGYFVFMPNANIMIVKQYNTALSIGTGVAIVLYILLGFILSKIFRTGKIGNWF
jgi:hypothetical protein